MIFPLWFLTCCQPSEKVKPEHSSIPATEVPTRETNYPSAPSDDIPVPPTQSPAVLESVSKDPLTTLDPADEIKLPLKQKDPAISDEDIPVPVMPQPPVKAEPGQLLSTKPTSPINPGDDILSPPEPEAPRNSSKRYFVRTRTFTSCNI
ncbi:hypothetical protein BVRB_3g050400 isoform B [Beta vulgaris subsp. vulgaris]|uniref:Uncharacterized protein n=1 Tax=Beta vulgaris subsp. vulgaris TaxID=3555 RepID=A0A0J8CS26_BETVV|nr:hypothetical protein BVRB_3g050400 isoform B [Beta vulgaris subsp. vulgaris]